MARIAVVGSVACDEVVLLRQPLRTGRHIEGRIGSRRLGGGGACTAVPLAMAGHAVSLISAIGDDELSDHLLAELAATGVSVGDVVRLKGGPTRSIVMIDELGERTIVNLERRVEEDPPLRLLDVQVDLVYVRSRARELEGLMRIMSQRCRVVAHIPPISDGARPAQILVGSASDIDSGDLNDLWALGQRVGGEVVEWVVLTSGGGGAMAVSADQVLKARAPKVEAVDTTGAGDAFSAGLSHALASGQPMQQALETAVQWGSESVKWHASILPAEAFRRLM
ncbi:MAG: bifunctional hydroxymethylpyrimidine kinase/phosphomethylpyrimidine kinase [Rhodobacterales bacterium]|nr:bifunctional hydroxymethylpyrimidine kinase/phosphomethylpyrimidine kinase [Rhodobacterales bacterium]